MASQPRWGSRWGLRLRSPICLTVLVVMLSHASMDELMMLFSMLRTVWNGVYSLHHYLFIYLLVLFSFQITNSSPCYPLRPKIIPSIVTVLVKFFLSRTGFHLGGLRNGLSTLQIESCLSGQI